MVELESEGEMTRTEVAGFFRQLADELDGADEIHEVDDEGLGEDRDDRASEPPHQTDPNADDRDDETRVAGAAERITFVIGGDSATVTVPETVEFDVDVESRSPLFSSAKSQEIDIALSWKVETADDVDGDRIDIQ